MEAVCVLASSVPSLERVVVVFGVELGWQKDWLRLAGGDDGGLADEREDDDGGGGGAIVVVASVVASWTGAKVWF